MRLPAIVLLLVPALALAAGKADKKKTPAPLPTPETLPANDLLDGVTLDVDLDAPIEDAVQKRGGDYEDATLLYTIPSPGPDWVRISPVESAPRLAAAFVHVRGTSVLSMIAVTVDRAAKPNDPAQYAQKAFQTLSAPPLLFKVDDKGPLKIAKRTAFRISYHSAKGDRGYEQVYLPGPGGSIIVLTFQSPKSTFVQERMAFRQAAGNIAFK